MAVILKVERRSVKARIFLALVYTALLSGGITMLWPFMVMVSASFTSAYDYHRHAPAVRAFWSRSDRFMRYLASCFDRFPVEFYPQVPAQWGSWVAVSRDEDGCREFARAELAAIDDPERYARHECAAADYSRFNLEYDPFNSVCNYDARHIAHFTRGYFERRLQQQDRAAYDAMNTAEKHAAALALLNEEWTIRYQSFFGIRMVAEQRAPLHHAGWDYPPDNSKFELFQSFKQAYRELEFESGCMGWRSFAAKNGGKTHRNRERFREYAARHCPMTPVVPYASRTLWLRFLQRPDSQVKLGFTEQNLFTPDNYSAVAGHCCKNFTMLPFPLPAESSEAIRTLWNNFVHHSYPRRLLRVRSDAALEADYQRYIRDLCKSIDVYNQLSEQTVASFEDIRLNAYENSTLWRNFIPQVPLSKLEVLSAEKEWQSFILTKYGSLDQINNAYGWKLNMIEEVRFPIPEAVAVTFKKHGWRKFISGISTNYRMVGEYLFLRGRAFGNTLLLVVLSVLATLTVNPLAAYALSRFGLRSTEKILLFLLATMAFPAAVTAIPGFLLIRDLGLLNTFAALVLPTLASGMSIFILKGFFDGLPRELYEAATVDGAKEWQIFLRITLPMTTPILAVNALHSFVAAYNSWEWALLVCQKQSHWTLAVWMYQMSQQFGGEPWAVMAGFVMVSIPTAVVFIACQKIILRGIVLPSMK